MDITAKTKTHTGRTGKRENVAARPSLLRIIRGLRLVVGPTAAILSGFVCARLCSYLLFPSAPTSAWKPFLLFGYGLAAALVCLLVALTLVVGVTVKPWAGRFPRRGKLLLYTAAGLIVLDLSIILDSTAPSAVGASTNGLYVGLPLIKNNPPGQPVPVEQTLSVWFANGNHEIKNAHEIQQLLAALKECGATSPLIRGFASSAKFSKNSDENNKMLANDRGKVVYEMALPEGLTPSLVIWKSFDEMSNARGFSDEGAGKRKLSAEQLNRRTEMVFTCQK